MKLYNNALPLLTILITCSFLSLFWINKSNGIFNSDNYISYSYNLLIKSVYSGQTKYSGYEDDIDNISPTWRRAPAFPVLMAGVFLITSQEKNLIECFDKINISKCDELFYIIKLVNSILFFICIAFVFKTCNLFSLRPLLPSSIALISALILSKEMTISSHSEPLALTIYSIFCFYFSKWVCDNKRAFRYASLSSLFLAILILTRSVYLYFIPFLILIIIILALRKNEYLIGKLKPMVVSIIILITFLSPWLARNYYHFGQIDIANSGVVKVLAMRAEHNAMTNSEYLAGFVYWIPIPLLDENIRKLLVSKVFGRFDPGNENGFRKAGYKKGYLLTQSVGYKKAKFHFLKEILSKPGNNLKMSILFSWRGIHYAFLFTPFFILLMYRSIRYKKYNHFLLTFGLSLFNLLFHAFITHFNIRYGYPLVIGFAPAVCILLYMDNRKYL